MAISSTDVLNVNKYAAHRWHLFVDQSYLQQIKKRLSSLQLPESMAADLERLFILSSAYKNTYPGNNSINKLVNSLLLLCSRYIDAVINAYQENPARETVLIQNTRLITTLLENPSAENIRIAQEHTRNLPSGLPKKLKLVGAITLSIISILIGIVGVLAIAAGLSALFIPANPVSLCLILAGIGLLSAAIGAASAYGSKEMYDKIIIAPDLASDHLEFIDDIKQRTPKPR
ncbi:hypothetical protein [Legionella fairfieldensis]|uniref:hypothetical protein n=1 Tax=Legionella fairfieldensis TaxID=45064 RepID=UPI00048DF92B|nr:hypothetical protein [Legionella fairfieldensis]